VGIKIVSDNCCDLPKNLLEEYGINLAHLTVSFEDQVYSPKKINNGEFYSLMKSSPVLPHTSQPSVEDITRVYKRALEDGSEVIAIHMSSGLSGTYQGGLLAQKNLNNPRLHVFDSLKASVGMGLLVIAAARLAEQGNDVKSIMQRLEEMQTRMQCIFVVGSLECLIKGGRISRTKGLMADVLDIKPVLHMDEGGFIKPYDKARGLKGAQHKLIKIMEKNGAALANQTVGICHSLVPDIADYLSNTIKDKFGVKEVIVGEIGPVIGSHVGAGTFSVFFEK